MATEITQFHVKNCARCGGEHLLAPKKFDRPFAPSEAAPIVWGWWAMCPTSNDPVLFAVTDGVATLDDVAHRVHPREG
jgi:hypothetical protein